MPAIHATPAPDLLGIPVEALEPGTAYWTAREIAQQPRMLRATQAMLDARAEAIAAFVAPLLDDPEARVILTGAGTSAFIGECLAPLLDRRHAARVDAVATTDIVSAPRLYLAAEQPLLLVSFGRSGNSPESIAAVELAETLVREVRHLIITCNAGGTLANPQARQSLTLLLPEDTHDRGFAMTSSFSCMMYAALAALDGIAAHAPRIGAIARACDAALERAVDSAPAIAAQRHGRVVYLGSHIFKGLAREAALKLGELTNGAVATCFDSPLGFRHGPKTFLTPDTLVVVFVSNDPLTRRYDLDLVDELRRDAHAGRVIALDVHGDADADTVVVPGMDDAADADLLWAYIAWAQVYAVHASLVRGLTPDNPNPQGLVNRVVQGVRLHGLGN